MHILSKSTFIKGEQCQKALYMYKKHPYLRDKLSIEQRAKFKRGTDVGVLARTYFPNGINMTPSSPSLFQKMFEKTMENLNNPDINTMYEAIFIYNDTLIMLDILVRDGDKWRAIEVKSSLSLSETYYKDAALQYYVLNGCKVPISDMQLMYINNEYVKNGDIDVKQLFIFKSVKDYAEQQLNIIDKKVNEYKSVVALNNAPRINIGTQCFSPYKCEFLGHCWKKIPQDSFLHTTDYSDKELFSLYNSGITDNRSFKKIIDPLSLEMSQIETLEQNTYYLNYKTFYDLIGKRTESIAFLNILFYRPAVPILEGHKPYQEIVLAFSILSNTDNTVVNWNCLEDYSMMEDGLKILTEELGRYEKIIYFSEQNLNILMHRYNIIESKDISHKITNLRDILKESDYFSKKTKYNFTLKSIYEGLFDKDEVFEHSRIILNATSENQLERILVEKDMEEENVYLQKIHKKLMS
ncbi:MAG: hypothetical protein E7067_02270 [Lentimicrobiaceae bacterium]|nr:hypothetical protein [Lentimicrobiaceae bacterium]